MTFRRTNPQVSSVALSKRSAPKGPFPQKEVPTMYYVYILASATNYTLYIGVTGDLIRRVYQHKNNMDPDSFTAQYAVHKLVYFEQTTDIKSALEREKQLKGWRRSKKNALIETMNPQWKDLYPEILG